MDFNKELIESLGVYEILPQNESGEFAFTLSEQANSVGLYNVIPVM